MRTPDELVEAVEAFRAEAAALFRTARQAKGACADASSRFAEVCSSRGLMAEPWAAWADELGFSERVPTPWFQDDSHCVTAVWTAEGIFTVDWTAAQYGRDEFPLVRQVDELPSRDPWLLTPEKAAALMDEWRAAFERLESA